MRSLDQTDMQILGLLAENARKPFSEIADEVGLSGPAVSDRVERLQDAGVINRFTIDLNRSQLRAGVPIFVQLETLTEELDVVREQVEDADAVEHVFTTAAGEIWFFARAEPQSVRRWIEDLLEGTAVAEYSVTLIDDAEWAPSLDGPELALTCAECDNTVDREGRSARLDGQLYHFCCPSCESQFIERHDRFEKNA